MSFSTTQERGRPLEIFDEGSSISVDAESLDFVGAGVTATGDPDVTVTIPGGVGSSIVTVTGTRDDSNTTFTAATEPTVLVINGSAYNKTGGSYTWTYVSGTIEISNAVGVGGDIYGVS